MTVWNFLFDAKVSIVRPTFFFNFVTAPILYWLTDSFAVKVHFIFNGNSSLQHYQKINFKILNLIRSFSFKVLKCYALKFEEPDLLWLKKCFEILLEIHRKIPVLELFLIKASFVAYHTREIFKVKVPFSEAYSDSCQTSIMELIAKIINGF